MKRLRDKPLASFDGTDTFLRVLAAAKAGYITFEIKMPEEAQQARLDLGRGAGILAVASLLTVPIAGRAEAWARWV